MSAYPVNEAFRREVRERALAVAREQTLKHGWQRVRFVEVADAVGVSRPTMYSEFGNKAGLARALVADEVEKFLIGLVNEMNAHEDDLTAAAKAALTYVVVKAHENPLIHAVFTNAGDSDLLLLVTAETEPVLMNAVSIITAWINLQFPEIQHPLTDEMIESLVRLVISHLVQPTHTVEETIAMLGRLIDMFIPVLLGTYVPTGLPAGITYGV